MSSTIEICLVPSLLHTVAVQIILLLLHNYNMDAHFITRHERFYANMFKVKEHISNLFPANHLRLRLESFIAPILCESEKWVDFCEQCLLKIFKENDLPEIYASRQCWRLDGCIDKEKSAEILVKNSDISALNRFAFACIFCMFADVLDLWNNFFLAEKGILRDEYCKYFGQREDQKSTVAMWIKWLDDGISQEWESFTAWTFQSGLWKNNVYIMKKVLETSSPVIKSHYSLEAFHRTDVSIDVKRLGLIMLEDKREMIIRESPDEALVCFLPWPMRSIFVDLLDNLWPYITTSTFCSILSTILNMIKMEKKDYVDLLVLLQNFWKQSPLHCKKAAEKDSHVSRPLNFVVKYNFNRPFSRRLFLNCFKPEQEYSRNNQIMPFAEFLRNDLNDEYLFISRMFH